MKWVVISLRVFCSVLLVLPIDSLSASCRHRSFSPSRFVNSELRRRYWLIRNLFGFNFTTVVVVGRTPQRVECGARRDDGAHWNAETEFDSRSQRTWEKVIQKIYCFKGAIEVQQIKLLILIYYWYWLRRVPHERRAFGASRCGAHTVPFRRLERCSASKTLFAHFICFILHRLLSALSAYFILSPPLAGAARHVCFVRHKIENVSPVRDSTCKIFICFQPVSRASHFICFAARRSPANRIGRLWFVVCENRIPFDEMLK